MEHVIGMNPFPKAYQAFVLFVLYKIPVGDDDDDDDDHM
jgi:hypothetical protein